MVTNLLTNAMRYGAGKPIFVKVDAKKDQITITVRDEGRGIEPKNLSRIFQRFDHGQLREDYDRVMPGLMPVGETEGEGVP